MTQEEFYKKLKGFTYSDIPYLIDNNYIVSHDPDAAFFTVRKDLILEGITYKQGSTITL